jgi:arylsulfatase A-like enzyme
MALNIDVFPTIMDYCGVATRANVAGKSLRPLLSGQKVAWRDEMFYDYRERIWQSPALVAARTERYKLIEYLEPPVTYELYDLEVDPGEMRNVVNDPRYSQVRGDMQKRLERLKRTTGWTPPDLSKPNTACLDRAQPIKAPQGKTE